MHIPWKLMNSNINYACTQNLNSFQDLGLISANEFLFIYLSPGILKTVFSYTLIFSYAFFSIWLTKMGLKTI